MTSAASFFGRFYQLTEGIFFVPLQRKTIMTMELTEKRKAARKLASEYTGLMVEQETLVDRIVSRRLQQLEPQLEQFIERKIQEYMASASRNIKTT